MAAVNRLVAFFVEAHNTQLPNMAFQGQTPQEMYTETGDSVPDELAAAREAARQARLEANRTLTCDACPRSSPADGAFEPEALAKTA